MQYSTFLGLIVGGVGLLLSGQALAFKLHGPHWGYMPDPMGEHWTICPDGMPGDAVQRTKDGSTAWNYERFHFAFDSEACLSNRTHAVLNSVNQVDFGPLPSGVLGNTVSFFFTSAPDQVVECDMRFNSAVNWYTGTGTPAANQFDWWSVALHEMGHCLGLDHEDSISPLPAMRTNLSAGMVLRQLTADDIAGRNVIYSQLPGGAGGATAPSTPASTSDGGGGGCSLMPGGLPAASALFAALGNIFLPLVVLVVIRIWSRWRAL